ncbi:SecDF P1 head subdomain-containing protein [Ruegeria pomeroyi]|uniref:SecDF P1 head subdomain-containing protein n=1 Tax=Ruegeria pomeroyi TaxID=89184 RepID=UPI003D2F8BD6
MVDVLIAFTQEGQERLSSETSTNVGKSLALSIDGKVVSEPVIREPVHGKQILIQLPKGSDTSLGIVKAIAPVCAK